MCGVLPRYVSNGVQESTSSDLSWTLVQPLQVDVTDITDAKARALGRPASQIEQSHGVALPTGALGAPASRVENMTLCNDHCHSDDCLSYAVPLGECFSPPQLWPGDPQWGEHDVLDACVNATHFSRTFYASLDASCARETGGFVLPLRECIGPFGKPRPWGVFNMSCEG